VTFPGWFAQMVLVVLVIGFPIALILSWAYEVTPEGVKKTAEVDKSKSVTHNTGQKINKLIAGGLVLALAFIFYDKVYLTSSTSLEGAGFNQAEAQTAASIAVLPFSDLSSSGDQEYFADGLSEEILNVLVRVDDLTVASRTSSFQFKGGDMGVPEIAEKLKVNYVLEGSVRKAGLNIRVTGQLIEAGTDRHLWSDTFDRELTTENLFAIQDEIAGAIVEALRQELNLERESLVMMPVGMATENLSAYETFLKGRNMFHGRQVLSDISGSIELLEQAVADDPNFAMAWQWLAAAYSVANGWGLNGEIPRPYPALAIEATERALALDPTMAFAYGIRGFAGIVEPGGDYIFAMEQLDKGLSLDPRNVTMIHWKGIVLREMGYIEAAQEYFDRCKEVDPAFENCRQHRAKNLIMRGLYQEALDEWNKYPGERLAILPYEIFDSFALAMNDETFAARLSLTQAFRDQPDFPVTSWIALIQGKKGPDSPEARRVEEWLNKGVQEEIFRGSRGTFDLYMFFYISIGAYDSIDPSRLSPGPGNIKGLWMKDFAGFRKTPQFKSVVRNMNFLPYWQAMGFPPQCRPIGNNDFECE